MLSEMQLGQVRAARENWNAVVQPRRDIAASGGANAVDVQSTWAANHGIETLEAAEAAIKEVVRLNKKVLDLGGDPS